MKDLTDLFCLCHNGIARTSTVKQSGKEGCYASAAQQASLSQRGCGQVGCEGTRSGML